MWAYRACGFRGSDWAATTSARASSPRRRAWSCAGRSTSASPSSTPPISTAPRRAFGGSAGRAAEWRFPLASGLLTGKYLQAGAEGRLQSNFLRLGNRFLTEDNVARVRRLDGFARERGHTLLELAMSWLAAQPLVAGIIAGATRPEQAEQNAAAASWRLRPEDLAKVDELLAG